MISISIACALIIYLFGYLDSADGRGIASASETHLPEASQRQTQLDYRA